MKLLVTGRHLTITSGTRTEIEKKLGRLERLLNGGAVSAQCTVGREREQHVCDLTVHARGDHMLHGVGRHRQIGQAVAGAVEKITQQAHKLADRLKTRRRDAGRAAASAAKQVTDQTPAGNPRVIRARPTPLKPMSLDDAVLRLADGPSAFLVFRDAGTDAVSILYRRPDGHFGLIEPEV